MYLTACQTLEGDDFVGIRDDESGVRDNAIAAGFETKYVRCVVETIGVARVEHSECVASGLRCATVTDERFVSCQAFLARYSFC